eukprot:3997302-Amphidinium_carterae.1
MPSSQPPVHLVGTEAPEAAGWRATSFACFFFCANNMYMPAFASGLFQSKLLTRAIARWRSALPTFFMESACLPAHKPMHQSDSAEVAAQW